MEYKIFPSVYEAQERKKEAEYECQRNNQLNDLVAKKEKEYEVKEKKLKKKVIDKRFRTYLLSMVPVVIIISIAIVIILRIMDIIDNDLLFSLLLTIGIACIPQICVFACFPFAILLYPIAYPIFRGICNRKMKKAELKYQELEKEKERALKHIRKPILNEMAQHQQATDLRIARYTEGFEEEAQKLSVNFANSTLAKEVIQWLADGFLKTVKAADRASHIEKIVVPFYFTVKKGEIRCNIGKYNFEEHRCEELQDILTQAALARAIASQVQLNIIMQYDKDASGAEYKIDITYSYPVPVKYNSSYLKTEDYVSVNLVYAASNGNYKPVQKW